MSGGQLQFQIAALRTLNGLACALQRRTKLPRMFQSLFFMAMFLVPPIAMCAISWRYFLASEGEVKLGWRLLTSAHGLVGTLLYLSAIPTMLLSSPSTRLRETYATLWLLPVVLVGVSIWRFKGPKDMHLLLIALLPAMYLAFVAGTILIGG
jgi:hypothetical protein